MNARRFLVSLMAVAIAIAMSANNALAFEGTFSDVPADHTFYSGIMDCASKGITSGYDDGTFRPANTVTRAQFCVMLSRAFWPDDIKLYDNDANKTLGWFVPNSKTLYNRNALTNTSFREHYDNKYVMDVPITRYDMAQIMTNIMDAMGFSADDTQKAEAQNRIADYAKIPDQYKDAVKNVFALGIITGYADNSFNGDKNMNRGQGCVVIYRMIQYDNYTPPVNPSNPGNTGNTSDNSDKIAFDPNDPGAPGRYGDQSIPNPGTTDTPSTPVTPPSTDNSSDGTLANGKPATEENVLAIIAEFKQKYPEGTTWHSIGSGTQRPGLASDACKNITSKYKSKEGLTISMQGGCGGFASLISDTIFGSGSKNSARKVPVSQTRPGDVIVELDKNGNAYHITTATSSPVWFEEAIWHPETDTYTGMYYVENYDGGGDPSYGTGVVCTIPYCYLTDKDTANKEGFSTYVEVWTRYPD